MTKGERTKVWQNTGGRKLSSAFVILLCFGSGQDVSNLAFSCYLHHQFFNQHLFQAGHSMNTTPAAILDRYRICFDDTANFKLIIKNQLKHSKDDNCLLKLPY